MSGILNILAGMKAAGGGTGTLVTKAYALTSLGVSNAGDGAVIEDRKFFGFGHDRFGIDINGSLDSSSNGGYTVREMNEYIVYDTLDGSYGTVQARYVQLEIVGGPAALVKASLTTLTCSGSQVLNSSASGFSPLADGGAWYWAVTTNAGNETTADYLPSGTVTITV